MHRAREFFLSWPLLVSTWAAAVSAAPLPSLFAAVVPDADPQRSAQLAMREVLVRLVGSRQAADDPALAGVIGDAKRYVQLERNTTRGATQVIFDGPALRAAVAAAGRSVWDPDRPLVWVVLPALGGAATDDLRAQLNAAAQVRGLPIALVSADSPGAVSPNSANAGSAAVLAAVLAAARRRPCWRNPRLPIPKYCNGRWWRRSRRVIGSVARWLQSMGPPMSWYTPPANSMARR